jgi:diaminopimelate decarboxylase
MQTPYFMINQNELDTNFQKLIKSLKNNWNNYIIGYSYKTNALPWILNHFKNLGCFAEVVSDEEYELAKLIGVKKNQIIYNGPIKTKATFLEALENGSYVNIDSKREIDWLNQLKKKNAKIGIRVNFDLEAYCPNQSQCGTEGNRFGFCYENGDLKKAIDEIQALGIEISGLHLHTSSKTRSIEIYQTLASLACSIAKEFELNLKFIDLGGGFFGGVPTKPSFDEYFSSVSKILKKRFNPHSTTLIIEPGISLVGSPIDYVTSVIDTKDTTYNRFVITDGSRTNIDPFMKKNSYIYSINHLTNTCNLPRQVICGYTCMENDRIFVCNNQPELSVGDRITYHKVGAYTMCFTPLFIKYLPDVYVKNNNEIKHLRQAWTPMEYIQKSILGDKEL